MNERPSIDDEPEDPPPASDPEPTPRYPKQAPANKTEVTPLDEDENLKDGIEVDET